MEIHGKRFPLDFVASTSYNALFKVTVVVVVIEVTVVVNLYIHDTRRFKHAAVHPHWLCVWYTYFGWFCMSRTDGKRFDILYTRKAKKLTDKRE